MSNELIFVVCFFWIIMSAYVIHHQYKNGEKTLVVVLTAILLGPILTLIIRNDKRKTEEENIREHIENDRHRKWFRTMGEINRQSIPGFGRTIPPPPPMSQRKKEKKDFKFFRG